MIPSKYITARPSALLRPRS